MFCRMRGEQAALLACLSFGIVFSWSNASLAQSPADSNKSEMRLERGRPTGGIFVPPGRGKPTASVGGASRSQTTCLDAAERGQQPTLTPLTPLVDSSDIVLAASARPEFLVHVGETGVQEIFYALRNEDGRHLYQGTVTVPGEVGIARVEIPAEAPGLEVGENYLISFVAVCGGDIKPDSPRADVWIERVVLDRASLAELEGADEPLERATVFGRQGIWLDMVETLATLKERTAEDGAWQQVMQSVGLEAIASDPILMTPNPLP